MSKKIPDQAQSSAQTAAKQVSDQVRPHHAGLADAIGVVNEGEDDFGVGLPTGHPLVQTFSDLEYGSETTGPNPALRQLEWQPDDLAKSFEDGISE